MCECSRSLTFTKLLPYAKGLRFVVANLLVDDFQLVKGKGDIIGIEIIGRNYTAICLCMVAFVGDKTTLCIVDKTRILLLQDARLTRARCASYFNMTHVLLQIHHIVHFNAKYSYGLSLLYYLMFLRILVR